MLCFVLFSVSSIAYGATEDVASTIDKILWQVRAVDVNTGSIAQTFYSNTITAGTWGSPTQVYITNYRWSNYYTEIFFRYYKSQGTTIIAKKGTDVTFNLSNFALSSGYTYGGENYNLGGFTSNNQSVYTAEFKDLNGKTICTVPITFDKITPHGVGMMSFSVDSENLTADCYSIDIHLKFYTGIAFYDGIPNDHWNNASDFYLLAGFNNSSMIETLVDDSTGLLKGITNIINNIKDGISNLITGITELPSKLWGFIENGLKGLFVPSEAEMTEIKGNWDTLLSDRFGGLYQTVSLIDDYAKSFTDPEQKKSIKIPELKIPFGQSEFVFGGQDVQIVPDKFSFLIDVIKTIISIIATCLFVNGLRNRFERMVGGSE